MQGKERKVAANYIYWPGFPLVKNGYLIWQEGKETRVIASEGGIREIQGLEFYGGLLVPDYVMEYAGDFREGEDMIAVLKKLYLHSEEECKGIAIIERADLKQLIWCPEAIIRKC